MYLIKSVNLKMRKTKCQKRNGRFVHRGNQVSLK